MSVSYGGDSITFADGSTVSSGWTGFKNRVNNGAMLIDQRGSGTSTTGGYAVDRFYALQGTSGTFTAAQSSESPTGFSKSMVFTVGSAGTASAAQQVRITQAFEGLNMADLDWGKSTAKALTISFWVRSSVTGTYCVAIHNDGGNRAYIREYTISSANTWEQKSVTIPGCTDGTWPVTNARWGTLKFDLGSGSDRLGTAGSWLTGAEYAKTSNQVNFINNAGATFYLTGVQVELGSTASSFEYRPYGAELALCQRYYFRKNIPLTNDYFTILQAYNTSSAYGKLFDLPVTMRATPTGSLSAIGSFRAANAGGSGSAPFTAGSVDSVSTTSIGTAGWSGASGIVAGNAVVIACGAVAWIAADAEL
jgi:hypothetical protein